MTATQRPDTVMGQALADRVLEHIQPDLDPPSGAGIIDLTIPEVAPTPEPVREAAKIALDEGETHYTSGAGIPRLRKTLTKRLNETGIPIDPEGLGITNGGTEAIYIVLQSLMQPGEQALIVEPMSPHIVEMVSFVGAVPIRLETSVATGFVPDIAGIEASDAKVLLLTSPSPVTGKLIPPDELDRIITAARDREMTVILDLSYLAGLYIADTPPLANPELASEIILIGSFSTTYGLSGWRIGFFSAPTADARTFNNLKGAMSICTTAVSQFAAVAALETSSEWLTGRMQSYAGHLDAAIHALSEAGLAFVMPDAFPPLLIDVSHLGADDVEVARRLASDAGVIVTSGSRFGRSTTGYVRVNLGVSEEVLVEGIRRFST